jgi:hypothetical protein
MEMAKITGTGQIAFNVFIFIVKGEDLPIGARLGFNLTCNQAAKANSTAVKIPGRIPEISSFPIDSSVRAP